MGHYKVNFLPRGSFVDLVRYQYQNGRSLGAQNCWSCLRPLKLGIQYKFSQFLPVWPFWQTLTGIKQVIFSPQESWADRWMGTDEVSRNLGKNCSKDSQEKFVEIHDYHKKLQKI